MNANEIADALRREIADYLQKPRKRFLQFDGHTGCRGDCVVPGDENGDQIMLGVTHERFRSPGKRMPMRILVHEDADPDSVRRLLVKALDALDSGFRFLKEEKDRELLASAGVDTILCGGNDPLAANDPEGDDAHPRPGDIPW